jgi:hypothetical protein
MERILEGSLARFEVPDLLSFLYMGQRTGVLVLERPDQESKFFLRGGKPVFATSSRQELRLGSMLVRQGRISAERLERALQQQTGGHRLGHVLLSEKILTQDELASYLKVQVSEVIFDTFTWGAGIFSFFEKIPPPSTAVTLEMDPQNLIMEGVRRLDERGRISELLPDLDLVVEAVTNPERVRNTATLTQDEWRVFFLIDGRRTLAEICHLVGNPDEMATLQILHHLVTAKFITLTAAVPEPPAPAATPAAGAPIGTQKVVDGKPPPAEGRASVEFNPGVPGRKVADDTREVVAAQAIPYMGASNRVTVSRLILVLEGKESSFPLTRDSYTLGRHRNNDIVVTDAKVSSFHARIDRAPDGFVLVDLKSRNGSFLNGRRVDTGQLQTGDEVRLGTAKLLYKVDYTSS